MKKNPKFSTIPTMAGLIARLGSELGRFSTADICCWIAQMWLTNTTDPLYMAREVGFTSPQRQTYYLLGVAIATPEPEHPAHMSSESLKQIVALLNEIELRYFDPYLSGSFAAGDVNKVAVPMGAFVQYFMSGRLSYPEQVEQRMRDLLVKFDPDIKERIGLSVSETLAIIAWIKEALMRGFEKATQSVAAVEKTRMRLLGEIGDAPEVIKKFQEGPEFDAARAEAEEFFEFVRNPTTFDAEELRKQFPESGGAFLAAFALRRGDRREFSYYASTSNRNPIEDAPMVWVDQQRVSCPFRTAIYETIEVRFNGILAGSDAANRYSEARAKYLEQRSLDLLASVFPEDATIISQYYETPKAQFEHDGLIYYEGLLLIIEAKSSDMVEPFRDPERAFERISRHFASDRGVQHGFEQGQRVVSLLKEAELPVSFYDQDGTESARINPREIRECHVICTTMESFGPLAVNLTYLLKKEPMQKYPIALNLYDLETMIKGARRLEMPVGGLLRYFEQRATSMGRVTADDELDLFGRYVLKGTLPKPQSKVAVITGDSAVFDDIYFEEHGVERSGSGSTVDLASRNVERFRARAEALQTVRAKPKVGRNEKCLCGSRLKFKKCCGR